MVKRKKKTKQDCMRHFAKRAMERFGLSIDPNKVNSMINAGKSRPIYKESNSRIHHVVNIEGREITVVYNALLHTVVTALPDRPNVTDNS